MTTRSDTTPKLVPEMFRNHGWIYEYLTMMNQTTEAPWLYNIAGGLAALGAVFGRRLVMPWGNHRIHANLAVLWIGPSAIGKSESMGVCLEVIRHARPGLTVIADQATPAGLLHAVSMGEEERDELSRAGAGIDDTEWVLAASEMATMINAVSHNDGMIPLITDILDNKEQVSKTTKGGGTDIVHRPTMTGLMCSTVNWMHEMMPAGLFEGGFMRRFLIVAAFDKEKSIAIPRTLEGADVGAVAASLRSLGVQVPFVRFELTEAQKRAYAAWKGHVDEEAKNADAKLAGLYGHLHVHVLRLTMLLAVSRYWGDIRDLRGKPRPAHLAQPTIDLADFALATKIVGTIVPAVQRILDTRIGKDFAAMRHQVLEHIRRGGRYGADLADLMKAVPCRRRDMDEILESLTTAHLVQTRPATEKHPTPRYWDTKWRRVEWGSP